MEKLRPKLRLALFLSLLYNLPRVFLNVHVFGSICSLYYNLILGWFPARHMDEIASYPLQMYKVDTYDSIPPRLSVS